MDKVDERRLKFLYGIFPAFLVVVMSNSPLVGVDAIQYDEQTGMPVSLSGEEFIIVRDTALSDPRVQELIGGRNYVISDCCGFYRSGPSAAWEPVINFRVANELQIGVRVDLETREVTGIETGPVRQLSIPAGDDKTSVEEIAGQDDTGRSIPILAAGDFPVLLLILITGAVLGGSAAGIFYYIKRQESKSANAN